MRKPSSIRLYEFKDLAKYMESMGYSGKSLGEALGVKCFSNGVPKFFDLKDYIDGWFETGEIQKYIDLWREIGNWSKTPKDVLAKLNEEEQAKLTVYVFFLHFRPKLYIVHSW